MCFRGSSRLIGGQGCVKALRLHGGIWCSCQNVRGRMCWGQANMAAGATKWINAPPIIKMEIASCDSVEESACVARLCYLHAVAGASAKDVRRYKRELTAWTPKFLFSWHLTLGNSVGWCCEDVTECPRSEARRLH